MMNMPFWLKKYLAYDKFKNQALIKFDPCEKSTQIIHN